MIGRRPGETDGASGRSCTGDHAGIQDRRLHAALDANGEAPDEIPENGYRCSYAYETTKVEMETPQSIPSERVVGYTQV